MSRVVRSRFALVVSLALIAGASKGACGDWPQWRCDAGRTAASPEELPAQLHLQWKRELPCPKPAFPYDVRLCFDASYEPVAMGKLLFVPSMVTDSVTAYDTESGSVTWRFFAQGPVRFAPVAWPGKVYFVSDDGYLYCLRARDGALQWRVRGAPPRWKNRKLLGHDRMVSRWPARGGPVLVDGKVFFAAGFWSDEGAYVCAVDAESGRLLWRNERGSFVDSGLNDHSGRWNGGLCPQGYLAIIGGKLVVSNGRALPGFFDLATGEMEPFSSGWGGRYGLAKGSWWLCGIGKYFFHTGDMFGASGDAAHVPGPKPTGPLTPAQFARLSDLPLETIQKWVEEKKLKTVAQNGKMLIRPYKPDTTTYFAWWGGGNLPLSEQISLRDRPRLQISQMNQNEVGVFREPILTRNAMYYSRPAKWIRHPQDACYAELVAYDIRRPKWGLAVTEFYGATPLIAWPVLRFEKLWSLPTELKVFIKAGSRLYCGAEATVAAVDISKPGEKPRISWQAKIDGRPAAMLAAAGRLFVVTREGTLYCFGPGAERAMAANKLPRALVARWGPWSYPQFAEECRGTGPNRLRGELKYARVVRDDAFGCVLEFNGKAMVDCGDAPSLTPADAITVEAWVKWDGPGYSAAGKQDPSSCVVGNRGPNSGYLLMVGKDGSARFVINGLNSKSDPDGVGVGSQVKIAKGKWSHLVGSYDGRGPSISVFVNGVGVTRRVRKPMHPSPSRLAIGAQRADGGYYWFQGRVARVRIFSRAATSDDVGDSYATYVAAKNSASAGRVGNEWDKMARQVAAHSPVNNGYCLVLGFGSGRLVRALLQNSRLHLIVLDSDANKVDRAHRAFDKLGLYGEWLHVLHGDLKSIELPPYFASLVAAESSDAISGEATGEFVARVYRSLRPYGGTACLPLAQAEHQKFAESAAALKLPGCQATREGNLSLLTRAGALAGAGDWTHVTGGPGNTYSSRDRAAKPPLGLLWFGGSLHRIVRWRENFTCAVAAGRMFLGWGSELYAVDAYTGREIWERNVRLNPNTLVALPDALYAVNGGLILRLNPGTGATVSQFRVPEAAPREGWAAQLRVWRDYLVDATSARRIVCLDRNTGRVVWSEKYGRDGLHLVAGGGRAYCVEYWSPRHDRRSERKQENAKVFALDIRTGKRLWERSIGLPEDTLDRRALKQKPWLRALNPVLGYSEESDAVVLTAVRSTRSAYRGADGTVLWRRIIPIKEAPMAFSLARPPVVLPTLLNPQSGALVDLRSGRKLAMRLWRLTTNSGTRGCGRAVGSARLVAVRDAHASLFDLKTGCEIQFRGVRAACNFNMIPADGLVLAPYKSFHCKCNYGIRTSFAAAHIPEAAQWLHAASKRAEKRLRIDAQPGQALQFRLVVSNLGNEPVTDQIRLELPPGWSVKPAPKPVTVPGRGSSACAIKLLAPKSEKPGTKRVKIRVGSEVLSLEPSLIEIFVSKPKKPLRVKVKAELNRRSEMEVAVRVVNQSG